MITIGITTYNRLDVLKKMAKSLYKSDLLGQCNIRVYDDASSEYDVETLKDIFPDSVSITRNEKNVKADRNSYLMYQDFLQSEDELLVNADSDLLFSSNWLYKGMKLFKKTNGVLSLYNSIVIDGCSVDDDLLEKKYVGSAGVMLSRKCLQKIIHRFSVDDIQGDVPFFDWRWCKYLKDNGHNIFCVKKSLVQHIGFDGQNSSRMLFDYGHGYSVENCEQGQVVNDILLQLAIRDKNARSWYALFPFAEVKQKSKIVIYGYGAVGKDYVKQIYSNQYCDVVAIVDVNYKNMIGVQSPEEISKFEFDYIIPAMLDVTSQKEIRDALVAKNPQWKDKIIVYNPSRIDK